jgi:hypothetical protein
MPHDTEAKRLARRLFRKYQGYGYALDIAKLIGPPATQRAVTAWKSRKTLPQWALEPVRALLSPNAGEAA